MRKIFYTLFIAALMSATGCDDTFYDAYNDLTGPAVSVSIKAATTIMETMTEQLKAEVYPSLTSNKNVSWVSNDTSIVTVDPDSGLLTGISVGTAKVIATTEVGLHTASCDVTVIALTAPDSPGALTLTDGAHKLTVSWASVPRATSYDVSYKLSGFPTYAFIANVTGTTYTITGLSGGTSYDVKINAKNYVGTSGDSPSATGIAAYALRDTGPAGGLIFYDAGSIQSDAGYGNWRYMEAAPAETIGIQWGLYGTAIGLTGSNPGTGSANTAYIITWLNYFSETNCAAQVAKAVTTGGYTWFLPSSVELQKMYTNLQSGTDENGQTFTSSGIFGAAFYWSSTEYNSYNAYVINFTNGGQVPHQKNGSIAGLSNYRVRAARRF